MHLGYCDFIVIDEHYKDTVKLKTHLNGTGRHLFSNNYIYKTDVERTEDNISMQTMDGILLVTKPKLVAKG